LTRPKIANKTVLVKLNQIYSDPCLDDWENASASDFESKSALRERFENKELIATGGMKNIFKVFDSKTNRYIALAELRDDVPEEQCETFLKEAYLTAGLEHPNIISIYDIGVYENHYPFFTMELKVGDSLSQILRLKSESESYYSENYDLSKLLNIYLKVCDAVSYAHSHDILHLDIKPENIQVGTFGEVQLCDWGLGSNIEELKKQIGGNIIKGTPGYMSPEQILPNAEKNQTFMLWVLYFTLYLLEMCPQQEG
jgi:serine/threonine protein kinase